MRHLRSYKPVAGVAAFLAIVIAADAHAESAALAWTEAVGVTGVREPGYHNPATLTVPDNAGNSIYIGQGRTSTGAAVWVNKLSLGGAFSWGTDLGVAVGTTLAADVITDKLGNVFVAGSTTESLAGGNQGGFDGFVAKLSADNGAPVWIRQIGSTADDRVTKIARNAQGNIYAAMGSSLVKLNPKGAIAWKRTTAATNLRLDAAGNAIVAGTDSAGKSSVSKWLPTGQLAWKKSLSGPATTLAVDPLGRTIVGYANRLAKYGEDGALQWRRPQIVLGEISLDANGDIYAMTPGRTLSKLSGADGVPYWSRYVDPNSSHSVEYLRTDSNGNSAVVGAAPPETGSSIEFYWAAKYDADGNMMWYQRANNPDEDCDVIYLADGSLHRTGDVFVALNTEDSFGSRHVAWAIRFDTNP